MSETGDWLRRAANRCEYNRMEALQAKVREQDSIIAELRAALREIRETCVGPEAWMQSYRIANAALKAAPEKQ